MRDFGIAPPNADDDPFYKTSASARQDVYSELGMGQDESSIPAMPAIPPMRLAGLSAPVAPAPAAPAAQESNLDFIRRLANQYRPGVVEEKPKKDDSDFGRRFSDTFTETKALAAGTAAFVADVFGADKIRDNFLKSYSGTMKQVEARSKESDSLSNVLEGNGDFIDWLQAGAGYVAGQAVQTVAAAGAGAILGSAAPGAGTIAGGLTGLFGKEGVKTGLKKILSEKLQAYEAAALARGATEQAARQAAVQTAFRGLGAATAVQTLNLTQELGSIFPDAVEEAAKTGEEYSLGRVFASAVAASGIDTLTDIYGIKVLKGAKGGGAVLPNIAREGFKQGLLEGGTEGVQTVLERFGAKKDLANNEAIREYVDSVGLGVLGGTGRGGITGVVKSFRPEDATGEGDQKPKEPEKLPESVLAERQKMLDDPTIGPTLRGAGITSAEDPRLEALFTRLYNRKPEVKQITEILGVTRSGVEMPQSQRDVFESLSSATNGADFLREINDNPALQDFLKDLPGTSGYEGNRYNQIMELSRRASGQRAPIAVAPATTTLTGKENLPLATTGQETPGLLTSVEQINSELAAEEKRNQDAFRLAEVRRQRAQKDVLETGVQPMDTQAGGRPGGIGATQEFAYFNPVIRDGQMVSGDRVEVVSGDQILDRITLGGLATTPERAIFLRFLDRPGQPEFPVPVSLAMQAVKFFDRPESPRAAQDFADTATAPRPGVMTDPEATRGGPRLATDRITTDQSQQFVPGEPSTAPTTTPRGGQTFENEASLGSLPGPDRGQGTPNVPAAPVAPSGASQTPSEAPGATRAKKVSKKKSKKAAPATPKTPQQTGESNAPQEGNQQQGYQRQREGNDGGREAGGRQDRQRQAKKSETRAEDRGSRSPQKGGQDTQLSLDLKRRYLGEDVESIDELNRAVNADIKRENPDATFRAVRVPIISLVGKVPGLGVIEQTARLFGKRIVFFRVEEGVDFFDGTVLPGNEAIFINVNSVSPHIRILGHELVHSIRKNNPATYKKLVDALQPILNERGMKDYEAIQRAEGVTTADKILEEAIGDIVGDRFGETEFWKMMADNNPSAFRDVARAVIGFIDRLLNKIAGLTLGSETLIRDLKAARTEVARVLSSLDQDGGSTTQGGPAYARKRGRGGVDTTAVYVTKEELRKVRSILPDHPDAEEHLRVRMLQLEKGTGDYKNERRVLEKDGFRFVIGRITTQDWIDRVQSTMTPQEVSVFRNWYRDTVGEFKSRVGDDWALYMIPYLLGNKAESPRGALNNALFVAENARSGGRSDRAGGLSDQQMKEIFAGKPVSLTGIGAKLYDFVDSALGKTTRSWMGNAIDGASPFVVDRHTFRDSGRVDPLLREWLERKVGADQLRGVVLDTPVTGSVSPAQYEQVTDWGNGLADDLNERNFDNGNWMPLEAQAVGWMAMTRLTETNAGGTTEGAMAGMTKMVAAELEFGEGAPYAKKFADYYTLSRESQKRVTHESLRVIMDVAAEMTGVRLLDVIPGVGGWGDVVSPNMVARFMSSDQTAEALVGAIAYLGQQTSAIALHPANAATGDRVAFDITGPNMSDEFVESTLWKAVSNELAPIFGRNVGFLRSVMPDGSPAIRLAIPLPFGKKKNGEPKTISDFSVPERKKLEDALVGQVAPAIRKALESLPETGGTGYYFDHIRVKGVESFNDWTKKGNEDGKSHLRRVGERFGPEVQGRLDSIGIPRVERAIAEAIRRELPTPKYSRKRQTAAAAGARNVSESGGVRGGAVPLEGDGRQDPRVGGPLEGGPSQVDIPGVGLVRVGKFQPAVEAAQAYMARAGLPYNPPQQFARVDPDRARRIAGEYDRMAHDPSNPEVRAAYDAMIAETVAQYRAILDTGLQVEFIDYARDGDPYAASPRLAIQDVIENNHLWVFSTADGFGSNADFNPDQNPLLRDTGFSISGKPALANDLFRVVHDYFGHVKNGVGFRADGEENAWRAHSAMYSPLARRAMTSETRGQNSWVNFGPSAAANRNASAANTVYADQKTGLLPEWVSEEGAEDTPSYSRKRDVPVLKEDIPNERWLNEQVEDAIARGRDRYGAPAFRKSTGSYGEQNVRVPVSVLAKLPGMRGEQQNVRARDLESLKQVMQETGKLPLLDNGKEYAPFVMVAYNGEAWVNEGNHRIMAANALGWKDLPVEVRYFDGGQRVDGPLSPDNIRKYAEDTPSYSRKRPGQPFTAAATAKLQQGPAWFESLPQEQKDALRKAGAVPAKLTWADRVSAMKENFGAKVVQGVFDKFRRIQDLDPVAYMQARMSTAVDGAFEFLMLKGQVKWEGGWLKDVPGTKGLMEILQQLPQGEVDRFFWWVAANRAEKLSAEQREFLFSGKDISALKRLNQAGLGEKNATRPVVYSKVLFQLNQLNKSVLDVAKQSGLINQEQYNRFAADAFYVPFYRLMEDGDISGAATAAGLVGQEFSKRLKGSERQLNDLLANYLNNWEHILTASAKNMAGKNTLDAAEMAGIATKVKPGMDPPKGSVKVMVDGKAQHYVVDDPMLLDSISSLYAPALSGYGVKIMGAFKRVFTKTVTISPVFKFYNNLIRDAITSQALSPELSNNPIANTYRGFKLNNPKNPLYNSMLVGGGLFKNATWDEGDRHEYVKRLIAQNVDPNTILNTPQKLASFLKGPFKKYMEIGDRAENAQRATIYESAIKAGKSQLEAAFLARQPIDFSLTGSSAAIRYLSAILPFFNARLQGMYSLGKYGIAPTARVMYNMTTGKPVDATEAQRAARFTGVIGAVTAATILLYLINKDDEDFQRREDWDRDSFWWIKINGVGWRIPKPFEIGAFATIIERGLEQVVDQNVEGKVFARRLWSIVTDQLSMNMIPQVIRPALDVYSNYDSFRDRRIESLSMQNLPKEYRTNPNTSFVANAMGSVSATFADVIGSVAGKKAGEAVQLSPIQIDYLVKGYLGWVGAQGLAVADSMAREVTGAPDKPTPRFQERLPVQAILGGTFQELPTRGNKVVGEFYEQAKEIDGVMNAIRSFRQARDIEKAQQLMEENKDKVALSKLYSHTQKRLSEINKRITLISADKEMSADEKRAAIDQLEQIRDELAGNAEKVRKSQR